MRNPLLRLTQSSAGKGRYRVEVSLEAPGQARQAVNCVLKFGLSEQDREDLRWYLEDYLQYPLDPAPQIAARIEQRMAEIGVELFKAIFQANEDARDLWATLRDKLADTRIEVVTGVRESAAVPWELIRDPKTDTPLALQAGAFVRSHPQTQQRPGLPEGPAETVRVLLVICRPSGGQDVPFRSVASRLLKGLGGEARAAFQLEVLRPATFEQLALVLRRAKEAGQPYHIVHFDGHGLYLDEAEAGDLAALRRKLSHLLLSSPRAGAHGYLAFENPRVTENMQLVDGPTLGRLLVETGVSFLILNACRSAHAETLERPEPKAGDGNTHDAIRALGSLAQEVVDTGVPGVVAMRYNVYVVTAAQFVAELYGALARGQSLGTAVSLGRKQLHANPQREIALKPIPLQDWCVPVVFEAAPVALFPRPLANAPLSIKLETAPKPAERKDEVLPPPPDAGFYGRDETLLAIDRAFDSQSIVLLHAFAGSGKTSTAAEFARWYGLTGGIQGPVLFTSFEQHKPLARVLDQMERVFGPALERAGVHWLTLDDAQRRQTALQVMKQVPVLWIWDNVEPVAGFPSGTRSAWSEAEQKELVDFLRAARETRAKFLLTSRRDEQGWLGDLPVRISVPPMPLQESVQLVRALALRQGKAVTAVEDWRPLLKFAGGNPLTMTVVVGQALRNGLKTREQIEAFVEKLRAGEAAFEDDVSQGRSKSLDASLSYGFEHAFNEQERRILALLHLFQGFVVVDALHQMGHLRVATGEDFSLPIMREVSHETIRLLLDRAAEVGLLTAHGSGYYTIHPALNLFLRDHFTRFYPAGGSTDGQNDSKDVVVEMQRATLKGEDFLAVRAHALAMSALSDYYCGQYQEGDRNFITALQGDEANLLQAGKASLKHGWWRPLTGIMRGLLVLYEGTSRMSEWVALMEEILPSFIDPTTESLLPSLEEHWDTITGLRARAAMATRSFDEAERLQRLLVEHERKGAAAALASPAHALGPAERASIRWLADRLNQLGNVLLARGNPESLAVFQEDYDLSTRLNDPPLAATSAFNLGHGFLLFGHQRDLKQAEAWYRRSFELRRPHDWLGRAKCLNQLGMVALERFHDAKAAGKPNEELLKLLNQAANFHKEALSILPRHAVPDLAIAHGQIGNVYIEAGDVTSALRHWQNAIRAFEWAQDFHAAGQTRRNIALGLARSGRFNDALVYAQAALENYRTYGEHAAQEVKEVYELIASIQRESA